MTEDTYEEFSLRDGERPLSLEKATQSCGFFIDRKGDVYFDRSRYHGTLPLELRDHLTGSTWYSVKQIYLTDGNLSFDLETPSGVLERVGYTWFDKGRYQNHQSSSP